MENETAKWVPLKPAINSSLEFAQKAEWITNRVKMVIGAFRKDDFADPESFVLQAAMLLDRYSEQVIKEATDPRSGIQTHIKFPPSLAELREFCDEIKRRSEIEPFHQRWQRQSDAQMEQRQEPLTEDEIMERKRIIDRVKNEMREKGFRFPEDRKRTTEAWRQYWAKYHSGPWQPLTHTELLDVYGKR